MTPGKMNDGNHPQSIRYPSVPSLRRSVDAKGFGKEVHGACVEYAPARDRKYLANILTIEIRHWVLSRRVLQNVPSSCGAKLLRRRLTNSLTSLPVTTCKYLVIFILRLHQRVNSGGEGEKYRALLPGY